MIDNNSYIGLFLKEARRNAKMTAKEASEKLADLGITISGVTISGYENNRSKPDAEKFLALCKIYGINNPIPLIQEIVMKNKYNEYNELFKKALILANQQENLLLKVTLTLQEKELLKNYQELNSKNKKLIDDLILRLIESQKYRRENRIQEPVTTISHPLFNLPASAGTGQFLDSDKYELVDFPEEVVPRDSNFAVRVSGDSMEPDYPNGSIVFVKKVKTIEPGEVGIFIVNGEGYLKKLGESCELISINPEYRNIKIGEYDNCKIVGKVVGTYNE